MQKESDVFTTRVILLSLLLAMTGLIVTAGPGRAESFPCDAAGVLAAFAVGGGPHRFNCPGLTVVQVPGTLVPERDVILDGEGKLNLSGGGTHRVMYVPPEVSVGLHGVTILSGAPSFGGGIISGGQLVLSQCLFIGNAGLDNFGTLDVEECEFAGSGTGLSDRVGATTRIRRSIFRNNGTGVFSHGDVEIIDSEVRGNRTGLELWGTAKVVDSIITNNDGPGIDNRGTTQIIRSLVADNGHATFFGSAGILTLGSLTLIDSEVSGHGPNLNVGGIEVTKGTLDLIRSVVRDNHAYLDDPRFLLGGGGILFDLGAQGGHIIDSAISDNSVVGTGLAAGGGINSIASSAKFTLSNSTISGNWIEAPFAFGTGISIGETELTHVTITDNFAIGADLEVTVSNAFGTATNSIIAGSCISPGFASHGGNVESPGDSCGFDHPTDLVDVTAPELALGPLADNGGPTPTHELLAGSVAIGNAPSDTCLETDQRGFVRPAGEACDSGAFE